MNLLTFKYTKANNKVSSRVLAILVKPNTMYEGIDITELTQSQQSEFVIAASKAREAYVQALEALQDTYDVKQNYRRFDPVKMSEVVFENL